MDFVIPILLVIPCIILAVWCGKLADKHVKEDPWGTPYMKHRGYFAYRVK